MEHSTGLVALTREYARVLAKRESGNVQCIRTPPLLIWGEMGGGVREMQMQTRPRGRRSAGEESVRALAFSFLGGAGYEIETVDSVLNTFWRISNENKTTGKEITAFCGLS